MDLKSLLAKVNANTTALEAKIADLKSQLAAALANAADPADVQALSDALDAQAAAISA